MRERIITIDWQTDVHDCDDCGACYAEGATAFIDGEEVLSLAPSAYCFNSDTWEHNAVLGMLLGRMGIRLLLEEEECDPEDMSKGRGDEGLPDLPEDAITVYLALSSLWDQSSDDYSSGYRATVEGEPLFDCPPELLGKDKSPNHSTTKALIDIIEHFGGRFTEGSIDAWMRA